MPPVFTPQQLKQLAGKSANPSAFQDLIKAPKRIKLKGMNKLESDFSKILEAAQEKKEILRWHYESITLKLAPNTRYTPDFVAILPNGHHQIFEIKGHLEDDAAVKFKTAAEKFPEMSFLMLTRKQRKWKIIYNVPSKFNTAFASELEKKLDNE
jgi:hypothetical protein